MALGQRRFWQKKKKLLVISSITAVSASLVGFVFAGYWFHWSWTGFNKTLWDWMQLLIIPVALALGAFLLNRSDQRREQAVAIDNQRETLLQSYLDRMSELLLERNLRASQSDDEVRKVARARTLTALSQLDGVRKRSLLQFLYESELILNTTTGSSIVNLNEANLSRADLRNISLNEADLSQTDLREANLGHANLSWANLSQANLSQTNLHQINLSWAILSWANLRGADLSGADLSYAQLSRTDLRGANLSNIDFSTVHLQGANLSGANLNGAKFRKEDVRSEYSSMTVLQKEM